MDYLAGARVLFENLVLSGKWCRESKRQLVFNFHLDVPSCSLRVRTLWSKAGVVTGRDIQRLLENESGQATKSKRRMSWRQEATKDVA
jgi:hypothetical protein